MLIACLVLIALYPHMGEGCCLYFFSLYFLLYHFDIIIIKYQFTNKSCSIQYEPHMQGWHIYKICSGCKTEPPKFGCYFRITGYDFFKEVLEKYIYVDDMRYMKGKVFLTKAISFQSQMTTWNLFQCKEDEPYCVAKNVSPLNEQSFGKG